MQCQDMDIKYMLISKLNLIEELSLKEAKEYGYDGIDIVSSSKVLTFVHNGIVTISSIANQMGVSRQAVHKIVKNLHEKGFLILEHHDNKRDKIIIMTKKGEELLDCRNKVMSKVEKQIADHIGYENFCQLKKLLKSNWQ